MEQGIIEKGKNLHQVYDEAMILGVSPRDQWKEAELSASSDTGDVSRIMPTCLFTTACWPIGCSPHTWQATASGGTSIGDKGALYASKVAAGIVYDLFTKPQVLAKITKEFRERNKEPYTPMYEE